MKLYTITTMLILASAAAGAVTLQSHSVVKAFYADQQNCAYMQDNPADASDTVTAAFEAAVARTVAAMQKDDPGLSLTKALLVLREGCNTNSSAVRK